MKKTILIILFFILALGMFVSCEVEQCEQKEPLTDSGLSVYNYVEPDLERMMELFENTLRLNTEMHNEGESRYFPGETIFRDQQGWWGVASWTATRFKAYPGNGKPLVAEGAIWTAISKYYSDDSISMECIEPNRWSLRGYTQGYNYLKTEVRMEISCVDSQPSVDWDSVAFYVDVKGISHISQAYPPAKVDIDFSIIRPLLRKGKAEGGQYPFMDGLMKLEAIDSYTNRKQQILAQIEELPQSQRTVRITTRGVTGIY